MDICERSAAMDQDDAEETTASSQQNQKYTSRVAPREQYHALKGLLLGMKLAIVDLHENVREMRTTVQGWRKNQRRSSAP